MDAWNDHVKDNRYEKTVRLMDEVKENVPKEDKIEAKTLI